MLSNKFCMRMEGRSCTTLSPVHWHPVAIITKEIIYLRLLPLFAWAVTLLLYFLLYCARLLWLNGYSTPLFAKKRTLKKLAQCLTLMIYGFWGKTLLQNPIAQGKGVWNSITNSPKNHRFLESNEPWIFCKKLGYLEIKYKSSFFFLSSSRPAEK